MEMIKKDSEVPAAPVRKADSNKSVRVIRRRKGSPDKKIFN